MDAIINDPTFWVALAFFTLVAILAYMKIPGMIGGQLDSRARKIETDIRDAEILCEEAQDLLARYERKQKEAMREAEEILENAKAEAKLLEKQGKERLEQSLARREKMAIDRIAQVEAQAVDDVRQMAVDIAMDAANELIAAQAATSGDKLISESIAELDKKLH
jgi:F-type H+-transporting ATPase subunit b